MVLVKVNTVKQKTRVAAFFQLKIDARIHQIDRPTQNINTDSFNKPSVHIKIEGENKSMPQSNAFRFERKGVMVFVNVQKTRNDKKQNKRLCIW